MCDPGGIVHARERPPCIVEKPNTPDDIWIPQVAVRGGDAGSTWLQLEVVMSQWRRIEALAAEEGPFIQRAFRSGLSAVKLD
jgi:hypothetical protein